jgi:hypothetical protein
VPTASRVAAFHRGAAGSRGDTVCVTCAERSLLESSERSATVVVTEVPGTRFLPTSAGQACADALEFGGHTGTTGGGSGRLAIRTERLLLGPIASGLCTTQARCYCRSLRTYINIDCSVANALFIVFRERSYL